MKKIADITSELERLETSIDLANQYVENYDDRQKVTQQLREAKRQLKEIWELLRNELN